MGKPRFFQCCQGLAISQKSLEFISKNGGWEGILGAFWGGFSSLRPSFGALEASWMRFGMNFGDLDAKKA